MVECSSHDGVVGSVMRTCVCARARVRSLSLCLSVYLSVSVCRRTRWSLPRMYESGLTMSTQSRTAMTLLRSCTVSYTLRLRRVRTTRMGGRPARSSWPFKVQLHESHGKKLSWLRYFNAQVQTCFVDVVHYTLTNRSLLLATFIDARMKRHRIGRLAC